MMKGTGAVSCDIVQHILRTPQSLAGVCLVSWVFACVASNAARRHETCFYLTGTPVLGIDCLMLSEHLCIGQPCQCIQIMHCSLHVLGGH